MNSNNGIGGQLVYKLLAELNRPRDSEQLAQEIRRLADEDNLSALDIAVALRIDLAMVREVLVGAQP